MRCGMTRNPLAFNFANKRLRTRQEPNGVPAVSAVASNDVLGDRAQGICTGPETIQGFDGVMA